MKENDLVRLAELLILNAKTTRLLADARDDGNGWFYRVEDISRQIECLADRLLNIAREIESSVSRYH